MIWNICITWNRISPLWMNRLQVVFHWMQTHEDVKFNDGKTQHRTTLCEWVEMTAATEETKEIIDVYLDVAESFFQAIFVSHVKWNEMWQLKTAMENSADFHIFRLLFHRLETQNAERAKWKEVSIRTVYGNSIAQLHHLCGALTCLSLFVLSTFIYHSFRPMHRQFQNNHKLYFSVYLLNSLFFASVFCFVCVCRFVCTTTAARPFAV